MEQDQQDRGRGPVEAWEDLAVEDKDEWVAIDQDQVLGESVSVRHVEKQSHINGGFLVITKPVQIVEQE